MVRVLPNRYIALLLTPREASMLEMQILDPSEFPWQDSESTMVAMGVKMQLHSAVGDMVAQEIDASISALTRIIQVSEEKKREEVTEDQKEPEPLEDGESEVVRVFPYNDNSQEETNE
jgi:hypothetical protein